MKTWLAFIGYIMSLTIIILHFIYVGIEYQYKTDNLLILAQTIFYFLYVRLLVGRLLSQFYYGWYYLHAGFLANLFQNQILPYYI